MELQLQVGWGMMALCGELLQRWGGGSVILSPRDLEPEQVGRFAEATSRISGSELLLDPQLYVPGSDHARLTSHNYWPSDFESQVFWGSEHQTKMLQELVALNATIGAKRIIAPGVIANTLSDAWLHAHREILRELGELAGDKPVWATVALGSELVRNELALGEVIEAIETWECQGVYLVCEHPTGDYLVSDAIWLANVLDFVAGVRLFGKSIILGYCNQQMLCASLAGCQEFASGTWMNVRAFSPRRFESEEDDVIRRRSVWYYCPRTLSEYKLPFLDMAQAKGVLDLMRSDDDVDGHYATDLFSGPQPSTVGWSEREAFRHFLCSLRSQAQNAAGASFGQALDVHLAELDEVENLIAVLAGAGVKGADRDFEDIVDVNRAAIESLRRTRGTMLERNWGDLNA